VSSTIWAPAPIVKLRDLCVCTQTGPIVVDMNVYRGDSGAFWVTEHECNDITLPMDVRAATWRSQIRTRDGALMTDLDVIGVWDTYPWLIGTVQVVLTADKSASLNSDGRWDLEMTLDGSVVTLVTGDVYVTKDVSQP
jgi:hypothetical protein